jgi:hypothetical protein
MKKILCSIAGLIFASSTCPVAAQTPDAFSLEYGFGKKTQQVRAGAQWNWERQWLKSDRGHLGGYWDLTVAQWRQSRHRGQAGASQMIADIGLTPVLRYMPNGATGLYGEAGIGVHRLSGLYDNDGRQLSTRFQFGDHIAVGYQFDGGWDASVKFQHFSNGGIKHPNGGVNYVMLRIAKGF